MKKTLAMLTVLCLLTACATAETIEINWADVEPMLAVFGIDGGFDSIYNTGIKMFAPSLYRNMGLSEDGLYNGVIYYLETDDVSASVIVGWYRDSQWETLEDFAAYMREAFSCEMKFVTLNGIPAVTYEDADEDILNVAMFSRIGMINFEFRPASETGYRALIDIMMASIQPE